MKLTLDKICTAIVDCEHKTAPVDEAGEYFAVGTPAMRGNTIDYSQARRISKDTFEQWTRRLTPKTGDLLFAREAPVGPIVLIPDTENVAPGQRTVLLRPDSEIADSRFLYYLLSSPLQQNLIQSLAAGSTVAHLNVSDIRSLKLDIPSLEIQRSVAEVLGALDDKIATNTKIAQTARELAQAEFIQLMKTASKPTTLRDVLRLEYGKSLATKKRVEGDADVFGSGGIVGTHNEPLLPGPGVIVGRKGTAGSVHWAPRAYFPIDTTFYVVPTEPDFSLIFCFHLLKSLPLSEMNSDSAVPGLNREEALSIPIRVPEKSEIQDFSIRADHFFSVVQQSGQESSVLVSMRDALLPHLISGKLRVEDAEKVIKETL